MSLRIVGSIDGSKEEPYSAEWVIPVVDLDGDCDACSEGFQLRMATHCERSAHCPEAVDVKLQVFMKDGLVSFFVGLPDGTRARWAQWIGPARWKMRSSGDTWKKGKSGSEQFLGKRNFGRVADHAADGFLRLGVSLLDVTLAGQISRLPRAITVEKGLLGAGSFGAIRPVTSSLHPKKQLCAKMAKRRGVSDFSTEAVMLRRLQGEGFAQLVGHYVTDKGEDVLVLQRLHRTLESLRADRNVGPSADQLSPETVITVGIQLIRRLQHMHGQGFVHNDLKPENVMIDMNPSGDNGNVLYLIDFGLSRHYRVMGRHMPEPSKDYGVVGTVRYCSIYAHQGMEARKCDMESLAHLLIYLAAGSLPWQGVKLNSRQDRDRAILDAKKDVTKLSVFTKSKIPGAPNLVEVLLQMVEHSRSLGFAGEPSYEEYISKLNQARKIPMDPRDAITGQGRALRCLDWVECGTRGKLTDAACDCHHDHGSEADAKIDGQNTSSLSFNCHIDNVSRASSLHQTSQPTDPEPQVKKSKTKNPKARTKSRNGLLSYLCCCLPCGV